MKFSSSYEPGNFEAEIYAGWEASGAFCPSLTNLPVDDDGDGEDDRVGITDTKTFSIVMPPPNANGDLHIGHGLTIALEDVLTRFYRLKGWPTWYIPGADHAGFETWVVYEQFLEAKGQTRFQFSREELYNKVWDFVAEKRGNMELQVRALGASCSWRDLTFTLDENVVEQVYATFEKMWKDGMIYRGKKLVNYCPKHRTAFADIEVEHQEEEGWLYDIAYLYDGGEIVVSTTRPETLFGDTAVAVNPLDERYAGFLGRKVKVPLSEREIPVILDECADMEYGTGAVKITPAHDFDDFEVGERHKLARIEVINEEGVMINVPEEYQGLTVEKCRKKVLKNLKEVGLLRGEKKIIHTVAHCYKCGTVLEPMLKEQWFVDVSRLAKEAIFSLEADEIKFYPTSKKRVLINYLRELKDWNISRQIPWGIAMPMFKKIDIEATDEPDWIFDKRTHLKTIEVGGVRYERDEDTFDTWFSSSHWPMVSANWLPENYNPYYPLNVMETGSDILFAWVARMIMMGIYVTGSVPFREVYLHGLVLDEHGRKMSKSRGNVVNPMELVARYGSDAFRLGVLRGRSAGMNQAFSEQSVVAGRNLCNKLWNVSRYIQEIVNKSGEHERNGNYRTENMGEDWICREIDKYLDIMERGIRDYRFAEMIEALQTIVWDKYADWFLESQKIYQNVGLLKRTLETLLVATHPLMPFVTEAIWQNLSWTEGLIMTEKWPSKLKFDPISAVSFERLMVIVLEIRSTLQALPGGKKWGLLYGDDILVRDNSLLIKILSGVSGVTDCQGSPRGIRLALANRELYLDVPEKVALDYKEDLMERILAVGRELNILRARMLDPRYINKAPRYLVKETEEGILEKEKLIERLKKELEIIK